VPWSFRFDKMAKILPRVVKFLLMCLDSCSKEKSLGYERPTVLEESDLFSDFWDLEFENFDLELSRSFLETFTLMDPCWS